MSRDIVVLLILTAALRGFAFAANEKAKQTTDHQAGSMLSDVEVRDWSKIDTDHDGYVEPQEMEKFLQAVWAQRGKNTATEEKPAKNK